MGQFNGMRKPMDLYNNPPSLAEYMALDEDDRKFLDDLIAESIIPISKLGNYKPKQTDLFYYKWIDIENMRISINEGNLFQTLELFYQDLKESDINKQSCLAVFSSYKFIIKKYNELAEIEKIDLESPLTAKQQNAGFEKLEEFGYANRLKALRGNDLTKDEELLNMPYWKIHREFKQNKVNSEIEKALTKS